MPSETPDFASQTRTLATALVGVFPDLTFQKDPEAQTVTINAGGLTLTVAPIPTPEPVETTPAEPLDEQAQVTPERQRLLDALARLDAQEGPQRAAANAYPTLGQGTKSPLSDPATDPARHQGFI